MKHVLIAAITMNATLAHAVGYMDTINVKITDPEQKVYIGSMLKKMEEGVKPYMPPVGQDLFVWGLEKYTNVVFDGSRAELSENIKKTAENDFRDVDLSAFNNMNISVQGFLDQSKNANSKISAVGEKLKGIAPESEHYLIDGITASMINKLNEKQIDYLAYRAAKSEKDKDQIEKQMYKLYQGQAEQGHKSSSIEKRLNEMELKLAEANKVPNPTEDQVKKAETIKRQIEYTRALRKEELKRDLQSLHNIGIGVSAFVGLSNPALGQQIAATNSAIHSIGQSLIALEGMDPMSMSAFGHYGLIANASISLFQSWGLLGGKGKDGIGGALKAISKQISKLQDRMDERFNRIENQLYKNHLEVIKNFAAVHKSLSSVNITLENTYVRIIQLQEQLKTSRVKEGIENSLVFLEQELTPIDRECLGEQKLKSKAVKKCLERYTTFIKNNSNSVRLTRVGEEDQWHKYYDYQVNMYAQSLFDEKKYSNPTILNEVKLRVQLLQKDYPNEMEQNIAAKKDFDNAHLTAMTAVVNFANERRNEIITDTTLKLEEIRKEVKLKINDEFLRSHLQPHIDELKIIRRDFQSAITDREAEIAAEAKRKNGNAGTFYIEDLQDTVSALKTQLKDLDNAISRFEKTEWTYMDLFGLPIIIKAKNGNAKPIVVSAYYLSQYMPGLNLNELLMTKMMKLEYELKFKSSRLGSYGPGKSGISKTAGGYSKKEVRQSVSNNGHSYEQLVGEYMMYDAQISSIQLKGTFSYQSDDKLDENVFVMDVTDSNQACKSGKEADPARRAGWFKNSPDPYSMLVMLERGSFKKRSASIFCWDVFKDAAKSKESTAALQKIVPEMTRYKNREENSMRASLLKGVTTNLNVNTFTDALIDLENSLAKTKGLLYLSPDVLIKQDDKKISKYLAIPSTRIRDRFFAQLELYFFNDTDLPFSDIRDALKAL